MAEDIRPEAAVQAAKQWLAKVYRDEGIERVGLEEVRFREGNWEITLGFNRSDKFGAENSAGGDLRQTGKASKRSLYPNPLASALRSVEAQRRLYKIVVVAANDNHIVEMRDREVA